MEFVILSVLTSAVCGYAACITLLYQVERRLAQSKADLAEAYQRKAEAATEAYERQSQEIDSYREKLELMRAENMNLWQNAETMYRRRKEWEALRQAAGVTKAEKEVIADGD